MPPDPRQSLLSFYQAALAAVDGAAAVRRSLAAAPIDGECCVIAIGKAAPTMAMGAIDVLGTRLGRGLVITRRDHLVPALARDGRCVCIEADHPLPGEASLAAGRALLDFLDRSPADARLLFLISGGASSLVECLPPGVGLRELNELNRRLLASGLDIHAINAVRRRVSRIKGGRLCAWLRGRPALALYVSDVRGDDPAVIGSGLLKTPQPALPLPDAWLGGLPDDLRAVLNRETGSGPDCRTVEHRIVAGLADAMQAAAAAGRRQGLPVFLHETPLTGEAEIAGRELADRLRAAPPGLHVWGGETTVTLPPDPGRGGRNQHLALAAALALDGAADVVLLAAGSDGSDGNSSDAGALVDGGTLMRGAGDGSSAEDCLRCADSGRFLAAAGDLIHTGPTGTNVTDLVLALKAHPTG
ncbi:MAG: DUF4147 domain-containing protein [Chromatiales bacterium]|nr:DUF4147 domain-containing protein [Chromatiales bacterium]